MIEGDYNVSICTLCVLEGVPVSALLENVFWETYQDFETQDAAKWNKGLNQ